MNNDDIPNDEQLQQEAQTIDLSNLPVVNHSFDHIVGNQLMCSIHGQCSSITVSPTAVLEPNEKGEFILIDKARAVL